MIDIFLRSLALNDDVFLRPSVADVSGDASAELAVTSSDAAGTVAATVKRVFVGFEEPKPHKKFTPREPVLFRRDVVGVAETRFDAPESDAAGTTRKPVIRGNATTTVAAVSAKADGRLAISGTATGRVSTSSAAKGRLAISGRAAGTVRTSTEAQGRLMIGGVAQAALHGVRSAARGAMLDVRAQEDEELIELLLLMEAA